MELEGWVHGPEPAVDVNDPLKPAPLLVPPLATKLATPVEETCPLTMKVPPSPVEVHDPRM